MPKPPASRLLAALLASAIAACGGGGGSNETPTPPPSSGPEGTVVTQVANEGWLHVTEGSAITYRSNPPASGPHYPVWLRYEEFATTLPRGYWVHNLEHGAIVFLYRPDAPPAAITALRSLYAGLTSDRDCGHRLAVLMPDATLPRPIAAVAADWLLLADGVHAPTINDFVNARRNRGPERVCDPGSRP
jgi:hypothetical protein